MPESLRPTRIDMTIKRLRSIGYEFVEESKIKKGANSTVLAAIDEAKNPVAIKYYPIKEEGKQRQENELRFLKYCQDSGIYNVPKPIHMDTNNVITIMSWLEGEKPDTLGEEELKAIITFVDKLNKKDTKPEQRKLIPAKECFTSLNKLAEECLARAHLEKEKFHVQGDYSSAKTINKILKYIDEKRSRYGNTSTWNNTCNAKIVSPSDIGIHNMIKNSNQYSFLDFEYGGIDSPVKLCADIALQPNHQSGALEEELVKESLSKLTAQNDEWRLLYTQAKPLFAAKWCMIIAKNKHKPKPKLHHTTLEEYYHKVFIPLINN